MIFKKIILEEIDEENSDDIILISIKGEEIQGRRMLLEGLVNALVEEDFPLKEDVPSKDGAMIEDPRSLDFDIDRRMPQPVEKTNSTEDTISILLDARDSSKILKIGSYLNSE